MNKPTEVQIKEFWEWCGFKLGKNRDKESVFYGFTTYTYPGTLTPITNKPKLDLNNLFKYAVPKLTDKFGGILFVLPQSDIKSWECKILNASGNEATFGHAENPALALFWAIWEVIHAKQ